MAKAKKYTFEYWKNLHQSDTLGGFSMNRSGLLWLKIKSILRRETINEFAEFARCRLSATALNAQFKELYAVLGSKVESSHRLLDNFIRTIYRSQIETFSEQNLVSELYKLQSFDWGGDYQNALDKYLVSRYIKTGNPSYEDLSAKFETEINPAVRGYVLNSWYNYWSSVLIENIFKMHRSVLPAVGKIKNVDFFIHDIPFDLKVTYLPAEYMKQQRQKKGWSVELTFLKTQARDLRIPYNPHAKDSDVAYEITEKLKDRNDAVCRKVLSQLQKERRAILQDAQNQPAMLAKWLYEHQGEMRFGAENRLFLVLADTGNFTDSWKLKRNIDLLKPKIKSYLNTFCKKDIKQLELSFTFKDKPNPFHVLADIIFVIK